MLRPATDEDREPVRSWRNHPEVRAVSLTQHEIGPAEHAAWWQRVAADPTRTVLIYERGRIPAGVVSLWDIDWDAGTLWWGYYLDNAGLTARGELLPAWIQIQRDALTYVDALRDKGRRITVMEAEVLDANEAVRSFNRRQGFAEVETYVRDIDGTPTLVHHVRRTRPAVPRPTPPRPAAQPGPSPRPEPGRQPGARPPHPTEPSEPPAQPQEK
ncbi:GNAT family N-acetyltransferase [Raineyella sp. W15-4]|uniref:GNAT family N-acetyltransferase n=1 Tax=Raineyella sp. W15-4 TaxID=3081651 RepID=UPI002953B324|nr:GNAT family N-acetyltransferase [Raineyella sp. W15-4]WOQ16754.1 GNAT family N-acetyltransferase [Raineyella sp. W15-4]